MATATGSVEETPVTLTEIERLLVEHIQRLCDKCDSVIQHGYHEIIKGKPQTSLVDRHRRDLHWALRSARLYERLASAHDFPDRALALLVKTKLRQLEEHWKYIYESPSKEESERLEAMIQRVFPDESRA